MHRPEKNADDKLRRVLITGANGFIGRALLNSLLKNPSYEPVAAVRRHGTAISDAMNAVHVPSLEDQGNWRDALNDIDVVIHTAARVHVLHDDASDPLTIYRKVNVEGTLNLARQAAQAGIKRFIFISSIKVNGEQTEDGKAFGADDIPAPLDAYGISKHEAEIGLQKLAEETGMQTVIIRPALVYGPHVKANFLSMMRWIERGVPLPLGAIHNRRSLTGLNNLLDLIVTCVRHPAAANQILLAADDEDLSTTDLLRRTGAALGKPVRLLPIPVEMVKAGATLIGKKDLAQRLCGNLQVDISRTKTLLSWKPPFSVNEELQLTAATYINT